MYDVDHQAVCTGTHTKRAWAYEQRDGMEQVGQVARHVQAVVERQHEQVACQDGDVVPQNMLF